MSNEWQWKCPSCDELLGDGVPYRTLSALSAPVPGGFEAVPIDGRRFRCDCGTTVDIPRVLLGRPSPEIASGWDEADWEYGYNTGSTVTFVGDRSQIAEWALVRGMSIGSGDWGSRIVRRIKAGPWVEAS